MGILTPGTLGAQPNLGSRPQKTQLGQRKTGLLKARLHQSPARQPAKPFKVEAKQQADNTDQFTANSTQEKSGPVLAILDDYQTGFKPTFIKKPTLASKLLLEAPTNGLVTHGQIVEAHAKTANPNIRVHRVEVPSEERLGKRTWNVQPALEKVLKDLEAGKPIDAINFSYMRPYSIERLRKNLNLPNLTTQNVHLYRETILKNIDKLEFVAPPFGLKPLNNADKAAKKQLKKTLDLLTKIAEKKAVYTIAGNNGKDYINLFSLPKGVHTVGAYGVKPEITQYSGNNTIVRHWAQANKRFTPIQDQEGELAGLTLNNVDSPKNTGPKNGQKVFIPLEELQMRACGQGKWHGGLKDAAIISKVLEGTSYTAPQVAAKKAEKIHALRSLLGIQPKSSTKVENKPENP